MKKIRVFKPVRAELKPSARWRNRPRVLREEAERRGKRHAAELAEHLKAIYAQLYPEDAGLIPRSTLEGEVLANEDRISAFARLAL
ncbi:hypothetical protein [Burkholderia multivorans]|uniref:hypothetical protein n=1 Tax=Burkholderia multivorans TaxID=87883 RepID=UPI00158B5A6E|nr:hypothetical protein [Burkholderia multivorans]MDR9240749.1 hypothetical protein [Burkholderia multivorans]MDR9266460.1 hypothetical protein [Burkholderia multivorans]MDR9287321.1 hypothetical protein [Burkholderia multivorans]MDR9289945.1 hypothetical protein [Burkholderia multivorans]MDR9312646.1 hypothetical protein [Burkholderia multivorans]